jgi:hypothetical protein
MFPITKDTLSFHEISDYWSREIPRSPKEILQFLEGAWWLGKICGDSAISRLELLKRMFKSMQHRDDLNIVFVVGNDVYEPPVKNFTDGSMLVTVKHQIPLPSSDTESWNDDTCTGAFKALARTSSVESYPDYTCGLAFINLSYDEFINVLTRDGHQKPTFWLPCSPSLPTGSSLDQSTSTIQKNQFKVKSKPGAKPKWDCDDIEMFVFRELNERGDFSDPDSAVMGWQSYSDLYNLVLEYIERRTDPGTGPGLSTLKGRVPAMVDKWRRTRTESAGN